MFSGFSNIDRYTGFDLNGAKVVIKDLAKFHAIPLALKLTKPDVFQKNIKPYLKDFKTELFPAIKEVIIDLVNENRECIPLLPKITVWGEKPISSPREPFATIGHCDLWTNNTMQQFKGDKIIKNKFVDFQAIAYRSPAADLFFFLWTSLPKKVLEESLSDLIKYYHECFINTLQKHRCDTTPFSFDKFMKEIEIEAEYEFGHAIQFLILTVHGKKGSAPKDDGIFDKHYFAKNLNPAGKANMFYMIKECHKRGWLY